VRIQADGGQITITSSGDLDLIAAQGTIRMRAAAVDIAAEREVTVHSSGASELRADGPLTVKGATVAIN
jgi:uncharacterized protein (DUF2345 family)